MDTVVLSLGSNKGDRGDNIKQAVKLLEDRFGKKLQKSPVYETQPLYYEGGGHFYNCCVTFESELNPRTILERTLNIENDMGRERKNRIPRGL